MHRFGHSISAISDLGYLLAYFSVQKRELNTKAELIRVFEKKLDQYVRGRH